MIRGDHQASAGIEIDWGAKAPYTAVMVISPAVVEELGNELMTLGWVSDLMVAGSLATGDYIPRISDLDLVALIDGPVDSCRQATLAAVHRRLDSGTGAGFNLGCVYVDTATISDVDLEHPTWTHGQFTGFSLGSPERSWYDMDTRSSGAHHATFSPRSPTTTYEQRPVLNSLATGPGPLGVRGYG